MGPTMASENPLHPIPSPPRKFMIGNMLSVRADAPVQDMMNFARELGPIFWLDMMGKPMVVVSGFSLVDELSDEKRFGKSTRGVLRKLRPVAHGLFTADTVEPRWGKSHNILLPTFAQRAMQGYHDAMLDVAEQCMLKWERLNPDDEIDVTDDMTRVTLDTIGLCGFDYRFNSFYRDGNHPFVDAMVRSLETTMHARGLPLEDLILRREHRQLRDDTRYMHDMVDQLIKERREKGEDKTKKDLLNFMLAGVDKQTGQRLDDTQIRDETIIFLIAGHETTSGMLSFAIHALLNHPEVMAKACAEVDRVLGPDPSVRPTYAQVNKLTYISQILKETLRLWPTAPAFGIHALEDTMLGGKYPLKRSYHCLVLAPMLHRDPAVWGDRPEVFNPDNFTREAEAARPVNAFKPFGNGMRACIGRQFAMQEATLVLGMILQRFKLVDHTRYKLKIKESLTIKPDGLKIKVQRRTDHAKSETARPIVVSSSAGAPEAEVGVKGEGRLMTVLYGTSLGTCRDIAGQIADRAASGGFEVKTSALDDYAAGLPETGTLVVVTSTYNGSAPDSATKFETSIREKRIGEVERPNLSYAVLGVGNTQWKTYQAFPKLVESTLRQTGAKNVLARGEADGNGDFDAAVEQWMGALWRAMGEGEAPAAAAPRLKISFSDEHATRASVLPESAYRLQIVGNEELVRDPTGLWDFKKEAPRTSTRHITIKLPADVSYRTGDHLAVYARNRAEIVNSVIERLGLRPDQVVVLAGQGSRMRHLPLDKPVTVRQLLTDFVELQDAATRNDVKKLMEHTRCPHTTAELGKLIADDEASKKAFAAQITDKRVTVYDLLMRFPAIELTLDGLLDMTSAIRPRFYSISSSPLKLDGAINLTVGTVAAPAWSGSGFYQGVASSFLSGTKAGEEILGFVRRPNPPFAPPADPETPLILVGPGTGFAPLRGFLQERAAQRAKGIEAAPALVFYGCRHPDHDWFYREEMDEWERDGVAKVHTAFSSSDASPHRFVQDALWANREAVWSALDGNGMVFVCGDGRFMAPAVREALIRIHMEKRGMTLEQSSAWLESMIEGGRYHQDVFGFK
jgi:cytochrome P450/NADPH-cytochrome P450 reductase